MMVKLKPGRGNGFDEYLPSILYLWIPYHSCDLFWIALHVCVFVADVIILPLAQELEMISFLYFQLVWEVMDVAVLRL